MFERFLDAWAMTPDDDALIRAARLMAQGTRAVMLGWMDLQEEQLVGPGRERLFRGELEEFPDDVRVAFMKATQLAPRMFTWLSARYVEHRSVSAIVEGSSVFSPPVVSPRSPTRHVRPRSSSSTCPASRASRANAVTIPRSPPRPRFSATPMPPRPGTAGVS
jgi:hypothetical protein